MKLNQIIAIEKGIKARAYSAFTELHKVAQKVEPYTGFVKTYLKKDDEGEDYPQERKKVQLSSPEVLASATACLSELFDIELQKDLTNCLAFADVKVGDRVLAKQVPATYLLFLEKQLVDLRTFVAALPVLDESEDWILDVNSNLYRTAPAQTHKTKKVPRVVVKYDAVIKDGQALPAQTELVHEDVIVGHWNLVKHSGAIPAPRKAILVQRVETLLRAVKEAREEANSTSVTAAPTVGQEVFGYLFS